MKSYKNENIYSLDDLELQEHLASNLGRYYSPDLVEQKDYSLEDISFQNDGINISVRIKNLYNSESYVVQKFVA